MFFLNLLVIFFSMQSSSNKTTVKPDISNPYGGISYPAHIESKIRFVFYKPHFTRNDSSKVSIQSEEEMKKILTEKNGLNEIIKSYCLMLSPYLENNDEIIYFKIAFISDIDPSKCTIMQSRRGIDCIEKIKEHNTKDEFEIEGKNTKDPFRLSENIRAYIYDHQKAIFFKIQPYAIAASTVTLLAKKIYFKKMPPFISMTAFFIPHLICSPYLKTFLVKMVAKPKPFLILFSLLFFVLPTTVIYITHRLI